MIPLTRDAAAGRDMCMTESFAAGGNGTGEDEKAVQKWRKI